MFLGTRTSTSAPLIRIARSTGLDLEVRVPRTCHAQVTLTLNGTNVDAAFLADAEARTLRGVLRGWQSGTTVRRGGQRPRPRPR